MIADLTPHFWITAAFVILLAFAGGCCVGAVWATRNVWVEDEDLPPLSPMRHLTTDQLCEAFGVPEEGELET